MTPYHVQLVDELTLTRLVECSELRLTLSDPISRVHARWLRGAVIQVSKRVEFHNHAGREFVYQHPLIRYDTSGGYAAVVGLAQGALLVRSLPPIDSLRLGPELVSVTGREVIANRCPIGPCREMIQYDFRTPYLALNQENHEAWGRAGNAERSRLLQRVLIGNILSLCKAIGLDVSVRIEAETDLVATGLEELKPGLHLLGFAGSFRVNFLLPHGWGIGKSSSRGFGTLIRTGGSNG